jgi:Metal-dependent hydrolase
MLINFCKQHDLVVMNTWFKKRKTKLFTWKSPGNKNRYQIDYILVKQGFMNSIRDVKTLPGADIDSDHNLLIAEVQTRLKAIKKAGKRKSKWNLEIIKSKENHEKEVMQQKFCQIDGITGSVEDNWGKVKETLLGIINNDIGKIEIAPRKP